jgi:signal transduction histidine kinase
MRHRSIRLRIFLLVAIPILALIGLYAFAATTTASAALSLARSRTVKNVTGLPIGRLETQIAAERLLAVVYLAAPVPQDLAALRAQQRKTDQAESVFRSAVTSATAMASQSRQEKQAVTAMLKDLAGLAGVRSDITSRAISRPQAIDSYGNIIAAIDNVLNQLILEQTNVPLVSQGLALVNMGKSEEALLHEDALLTGDMLARSFSTAERQEFTELVGARRTLYAQTLPDLDPIYRAYFTRDVSPQAAATLTALENTVVHGPRIRHGEPPVSPASWTQAALGVSRGFSRAGTQAANELTLRAQPVARSTFLRLFVVAGLGLLAVLLSIIMSIWIGRGLIRPLAALRQAALDLANDRLPGVVERLRKGEDIDVSAEVPPLESSADEIGQVREALNAVQRTAIEAAIDEAMLRRGISDVFRNLARRSQSLLHRQLALLDGMERRASGPDELEDLFRIDHLTTRMRRHAEGLIILSGESPGRGWRNPVPIVDVLRAAVAEVEDYTRIRVVSRTQAALAGPAVADVIHLVAELAENATIFSPPNTQVQILGDVVGRGFAVEIEDRGLGITGEKLNEINDNLASPPQFDLSGSDRLGLFIAGQLAQRHDIQITLRPSAYGGTTAIILIPSALIVNADSDDLEISDAAARERAIRLTGRHAALSQGDPFGPLRLREPGAPESAEDTSETAADLPATELSNAGPSNAGPSNAGPSNAGPSNAGPSATRLSAAGQNAPERPAPEFPADWLPADNSRAATAEPSASPFDFTSAPAQFTSAPTQQDWDTPAPETRVTTGDLSPPGLPRRIRQANLAPQLRTGGPQPPPAGEPGPLDDPSPEAARRTMTALQRGWERGRSAAGTPVPEVMVDPESATGEFALDHRDED